jgi:signal transduction histidine kinase
MRAAKETAAHVVRDGVTGDGSPLVVGAVALPGGGYAWAAMVVGAQEDRTRLRAIVLLLAITSALLMAASMHTLIVLQRETRSLKASLEGFGTELTRPVPRPRLRELDEIAQGIAQLAVDLRKAEADKELLQRDLAHQERLAALGRVAAGVAHEVRNPLAAIKLRADLALENKSLEPALVQDLRDISAEIARLNRFVQDLLVVAGRRDVSRVDADLGALARKRVAIVAPWARERGVLLAVTGEARAAIEEDAVARALDNLLRNAIEASPASSTVNVDVNHLEGESRIVVVDAGPGVDSNRLEQLFEPFFTTKPDGTGLGLALARAVASSHSGTVTYAREENRTRFTLTIPR